MKQHLQLTPYLAEVRRDRTEPKTTRPGSDWTRPKRFDRNLVVIGAGSAGLVSAYIAAAAKAKGCAPDSGDDLVAMLKKLGRGLFVTELMGQGVNYVTGDYSRGASGFWVENGEIAFPVHEITIAGNLKTMFKGIEAVGADAYNYGAKTIGSVLINRMKVAGS